MILREQILEAGLQIALRADAGDLGRHLEDGMRDLTGDHVHFVMEGNGDQHVCRGRAGAFQHIRMRAVADKGAYVQRIRHLVNELRRLIDHRDVVLFGGKLAGDAEADPAPRRRRLLS